MRKQKLILTKSEEVELLQKYGLRVVDSLERLYHTGIIEYGVSLNDPHYIKAMEAMDYLETKRRLKELEND